MPPRAEPGRRAPLPRGVTHLPPRVPLGRCLCSGTGSQHAGGGRGPPEHSTWVLSLPKRDHGGYWLYRSAPIGLIVMAERIQSLDPNSRFPKVHERRLGTQPLPV